MRRGRYNWHVKASIHGKPQNLAFILVEVFAHRSLRCLTLWPMFSGHEISRMKLTTDSSGGENPGPDAWEKDRTDSDFLVKWHAQPAGRLDQVNLGDGFSGGLTQPTAMKSD